MDVKHVTAPGTWRQDTYVIGAVINDQAIAIPASEVLHAGGKVTLDVGKDTLDVLFNVDRQMFTTTGDVEVTITDLLSWQKTYPATDVFTAGLN